MLCESVATTLAEGRLLRPEEEAHLATCAACARLVGTIRTWQPEGVSAKAPRVPSTAVLEARGRARGLRAATLAVAAVALFVLPPLALHNRGGTDVPEAPALGEAPADTGAAPGSPTDQALDGLVASLDRLDDDREALPGASLVDLLDPFGDDPVADPLTGNPAEGDL